MERGVSRFTIYGWDRRIQMVMICTGRFREDTASFTASAKLFREDKISVLCPSCQRRRCQSRPSPWRNDSLDSIRGLKLWSESLRSQQTHKQRLCSIDSCHRRRRAHTLKSSLACVLRAARFFAGDSTAGELHLPVSQSAHLASTPGSSLDPPPFTGGRPDQVPRTASAARGRGHEESRRRRRRRIHGRGSGRATSRRRAAERARAERRCRRGGGRLRDQQGRAG